MEESICSFFGHRKITENIDKSRLKEIIYDLIENKGINTFYFGGFSQFDKLCWEIVTELKNKFKYINRIYCLESQKFLDFKYRKSLNYKEFENYIYLPLKFDWWYTQIYYRNCEMIKKSNIVLFYLRHTENSGAYKAYLFAKKIKKIFIVI